MKLLALLRRTWRRQLLFLLFLAVVLFAPAGGPYWQAWLFAAVFVGASIGLGLYFAEHDPALMERRMNAGPAAEQEPTQKVIISLLTAGFMLLMALPGFDHRWHWSAAPTWLALASDGAILMSFAVFFVVMKQNSHAASTIQVEDDQPVISTGLYAHVRHPMYSGALLLMVATPLALGSYWSLLLLLATVPVLIWRILDEEHFLTRNLPGYSDYCRRTRYRLIPGLW